MGPEQNNPSVPGDAPLREAVNHGLGEVYPDLEIVDRELELRRGLHAEVVGVDANGGLVLVLIHGGDDDRAVLNVLDALAFADRHRDLMVGHLRIGRLDPDAGAQAILVGRSFSSGVVERLGCLESGRVRLVEVRSLRSARGERSYLIPREGSASTGRRVDPSGHDVLPFLSALGSSLRPVAQLLLRRIERLDDQLACEASEQRIRWLLEGSELVVVERTEVGMEARVGGSGPRRPVRDTLTVECLLDDVLNGYVGLLEYGPLGEQAGDADGSGPGGIEGGAQGDFDPEFESELELDDAGTVAAGLGAEPRVGRVEHDPGMNLTPEEREAFLRP